MLQYPVRAPRDGYRGADPKKRRKSQDFNRVAARVENHINALVAKWPEDSVSAILSYTVADALREDSALVHRIILGMDGGSNGVTVCKGDLERAMKRSG